MDPATIAILASVAGAGASSYFNSQPDKVSTLDKNQKKLLKEYINSLMGEGGQFADAFDFDPQQIRELYNQEFATPAYQQFQEEIVPSITGSFRGSNLQNSSYLGGALGRAGERVQQDLNAKLARMLYDAQQNSIDRRLNSVNSILGNQTFAYTRPQASSWDSFISGFGEKGGQLAADKLFTK